jgi:CheY-like chemotaxis protein
LPAKLLDVGNCTPDHMMISGMLARHFDVQIDRVMFVPEALEQLRRAPYDLVLVNRLIFADGSDGLELVRNMRSDTSLQTTPVMMISNFADAQQRALAAGALPGFGKAAANAPETIELLAHYLPLRTAAVAR